MHSNLLPVRVLVLRVLVSGVFIPARGAAIPDVTSPSELPVAMAETKLVSSITFMSDVVCGAVLISLIFKALVVPRLHKNLFSTSNPSEKIS